MAIPVHLPKTLFDAIYDGNEVQISRILTAGVGEANALFTPTFPLGDRTSLSDEIRLISVYHPSQVLSEGPVASSLALASMRGHENAVAALMQAGARFTVADVIWVAAAMAALYDEDAPAFFKARRHSLSKILRVIHKTQPDLFALWIGDSREPTQTIGQFIRIQVDEHLADEMNIGLAPLRSPIFSRHKYLDDTLEGKGAAPTPKSEDDTWP
jgi:hypothetical protein